MMNRLGIEVLMSARSVISASLGMWSLRLSRRPGLRAGPVSVRCRMPLLDSQAPACIARGSFGTSGWQQWPSSCVPVQAASFVAVSA